MKKDFKELVREAAEAVTKQTILGLYLDWSDVGQGNRFGGYKTLELQPSDAGKLAILFETISFTYHIGSYDDDGQTHIVISGKFRYTHPQGGGNGVDITYMYSENTGLKTR